MSVKWNPKRKIRQSYREVGRSYFAFGYSFIEVKFTECITEGRSLFLDFYVKKCYITYDLHNRRDKIWIL